MYALEIDFKDSASEHLLVQRQYFTIGSGEYDHVLIEDMHSAGYSIVVSRKPARTFHTSILKKDEEAFVPIGLEGDHDGTALLNLDEIAITLHALDIDLSLREGETPDRSGIRVLREACASTVTSFPAAYSSIGDTYSVVSFPKDQSILVGRSHDCAIRFDSTDISSTHIRLGFDGSSYWVEDAGSTNGTFVGGNQVSGRMSVPAGTPIVLGKEAVVYGVLSLEQIEQLANGETVVDEARAPDTYPVLYSISPVARPARYILRTGIEVQIGRDPTSDIWLGVPHISRRHCSILCNEDGSVKISDTSKNGMSANGILVGRGNSLNVESGQPAVLSMGANVNIALCFSKDDEKRYLKSDGDTFTFVPHLLDTGALPDGVSSRNRGGKLRIFYRSLSFRRKLFLLFSIFLVLVVLLFFIKLLIPILK